MQVPDIIIAIDGYSSTGKSTLAKLLAQEFSFLYLDSGAMYRGVTLFAQERGLIAADNTIDPALEQALDALDLHFASGTVLYMGERSIEKQICTMEVSSQVSPIAAVPYVRAWVDRRLHEFSAAGRVVMDGRDIGTTVFPNAELKIFITANPAVRARRRYDELAAKGQPATLEEVARNLSERDYIDSHREASPLRRPADAYVLDNSDMTLHEETVWLRGLIQGKFGILE